MFYILILLFLFKNNVKEKVLQLKVEEKEKLDIAEMKKKIDAIKSVIDLYKKRISRCERENENLIEQKMDAHQQTLDEEQINQMLVKDLEQLREDYKTIMVEMELNEIKGKENKNEVIFIVFSICFNFFLDYSTF